MNKKGFTLIELIGVIVLLSIITSIATVSLNNYLKQGREKSFKILQNSMEDATLEAFTSCLANPNSSDFCRVHNIPEILGAGERITLKELLDNDFIEDVKNPWKTSEKCSEDSYVIATRNSDDSISFDYKTCLICGTHQTDGCNAGVVTN